MSRIRFSFRTAALSLCISAIPNLTKAQEVVEQGYCGGEGDGTNLTWILTDDGVLTISGSGAMADFDLFNRLNGQKE